MLQNDTILTLIAVGTSSAFLGSIIGMKLLKKITFKTIQIFVGVLLLIIAFLLGFGII